MAGPTCRSHRLQLGRSDEGRTTLDELAKFSYGAQVGTLYYTAITDYIKPEKETLVFDTTADSLTALVNGQIDAVVQDLESATYITTEQFEGLAIAGQLPENPGQGIGMVFEKGSALVPYVNSALASVIADGTRDKLIEEWLAKTRRSHRLQLRRSGTEGRRAHRLPLALSFAALPPAAAPGLQLQRRGALCHCWRSFPVPKVYTAPRRKSSQRAHAGRAFGSLTSSSAQRKHGPDRSRDARILVAARPWTPTSTWLAGDGAPPSFGKDVRWP